MFLGLFFICELLGFGLKRVFALVLIVVVSCLVLSGIVFVIIINRFRLLYLFWGLLMVRIFRDQLYLFKLWLVWFRIWWEFFIFWSFRFILLWRVSFGRQEVFVVVFLVKWRQFFRNSFILFIAVRISLMCRFMYS